MQDTRDWCRDNFDEAQSSLTFLRMALERPLRISEADLEHIKSAMKGLIRGADLIRDSRAGPMPKPPPRI